MLLVRLQFDGYNRNFTVLDRELRGVFEDGEVYLLPVSAAGNAAEVEWIELRFSGTRSSEAATPSKPAIEEALEAPLGVV